MKRNYPRHLLSLLSLVLFVTLAGSSAVNKIHAGAFNYNNKVEDASDEGNYLVLNNGEKIKGKKISWQNGLILKDKIKIDDQKFPIKEVKGYRNGDFYYSRLRNEYIQRIVRGPKINVYVQFSEGTMTTSNGGTKTYTRTTQYAQKGENGDLVVFFSQKSIQELVVDCPLAVQMADKSDKEIRNAVKKDHNYLNSIFEVYNNDCRE